MGDKKFEDNQISIMMLLEQIYMRFKTIDEKLDCIQHTLCKNDDDKTKSSILKFLNSDFRTRN